MGRGRLVVVVLLLLASACATPDGVAPSPTVGPSTTATSLIATSTSAQHTTSTSLPDALFEFAGTVIESPDHGPEACAGIVLTSLPPQCSGIPLTGFHWDTVPWAESTRGSTWAEVILTGEFDGSQLTVVAPPEPIPADHVWDLALADFTPPCEEPPGGWSDTRPQDADTTAARGYAEAQVDFGGHWLYRPNPSVDRVVQVFTFTADLANHAQRLEDLYDGAICVGLAPRSLAQLEAIRDDLMAVLWSSEARDLGIHPGYPGLQEGVLITAGRDVTRSSVYVTVVAAFDHEAAQQWLDALYGKDAVRLFTVLTRLDP
jgi:hypothetical protein